ncbi:MAG: response regulator [Leptospirales bacterium]|jgi:DNA-binding response OmpR family regulator
MGAPLKILIADDEEDHITLMGLYLQKADFDINSAANSKDCLLMYESLRPDLIFLDVDMGFPGGFVTAGKIRERAKELQENVRIIMYTARKSVEDVQRARKMGADDYIVKPVSRDVLYEKIRNFFPKAL